MRDVLARAAEIQQATPSTPADLEAMIEAGLEVGIPHHAIERALRERLDLPTKPPVVGELTFATSADGKFYVAEVLEIADDGFRVRFLRGSEHTVSSDELRRCSFLPGERVMCPWPGWGPYLCTVVNYDAENRTVTLTDGWSKPRKFAISQVWLAPPKTSGQLRRRFYAALLGAAAAGATIGSIITALITK